MNNDFRCKPLYLKYPILQGLYVILWLPIGLILSYIYAYITLEILGSILVFILNKVYSFAFQMFAISGRFQMCISLFAILATFIIDILLLIVGLELISTFVNKKRIEVENDVESNSEQSSSDKD